MGCAAGGAGPPNAPATAAPAYGAAATGGAVPAPPRLPRPAQALAERTSAHEGGALATPDGGGSAAGAAAASWPSATSAPGPAGPAGGPAHDPSPAGDTDCPAPAACVPARGAAAAARRATPRATGGVRGTASGPSTSMSPAAVAPAALSTSSSAIGSGSPSSESLATTARARRRAGAADEVGVPARKHTTPPSRGRSPHPRHPSNQSPQPGESRRTRARALRLHVGAARVGSRSTREAGAPVVTGRLRLAGIGVPRGSPAAHTELAEQSRNQARLGWAGEQLGQPTPESW